MIRHPAIVVLAADQPGMPTGAAREPAPAAGFERALGLTIGHAIETGWPVAVVVTPGLVPLVSAWIATRDLVVLSEDEAARGLGQAIAAGVSAMADADGWLVLPGGMSRVQPTSMLAVGRALAESPVAYAQYGGRQGHPIGFASELFSELIALTGEGGARRLLARYPASGVEVDDPAVLADEGPAEGDAAPAPSAAGAS